MRWFPNIRGVLLLLGLAACSRADVVVADPSGLFRFTLPGQAASWQRQTGEQGVTFWIATDPALGTMRAATAKADLPANVDADGLAQEIREAPDGFPNARAFAGFDVQAMGAKAPAIRFECDAENLHKVVCAVAFSAGGQRWMLVVSARADAGNENVLRSIVGGVNASVRDPRPPVGGGGIMLPRPDGTQAPVLGLPVQRNGGQSLPGLPTGWQVRQMPGGVQAYEATPTGASLDLQVVPWQAGAAQLLHDGFAVRQPGLSVDRILRAADDSSCQLQFRLPAQHQKGEVFAMLGAGDALFVRFGASEGEYAAKRAQMAQVLDTLTRGGGGAAAAPLPPMQRETNGDGTAWVNAPAGWTVTGSNGILEAKATRGSLALGLSAVVFTPQAAQVFVQFGQPPPPMVGPFVTADQALPEVMTMIGQAVHQPVSDARLVGSRALAGSPDMWIAQATYRQAVDGGPTKSYTAIAQLKTWPMGDRWGLYVSLMTAESDHLAEALPTLWAVYSSFEVSPALQAQRWKQTQEAQDAITGIIQEVTANRARAVSIGNEKWDAYIRGQVPMIDRRTGKAKLVGDGDLEKWKREDPNADWQPMNQGDWNTAKW